MGVHIDKLRVAIGTRSGNQNPESRRICQGVPIEARPYELVLCRFLPAIENLSPWLKIGDNRLKLFTIDCRNSVMVLSFSVTFGSFAVG